MSSNSQNATGTVLYFSHGGGPLPLLGDRSHSRMLRFMADIARTIQKPDAIIVFSAHWEETAPAIIASPEPSLLYDYYGFPPEAYSLRYDIPGSPELARKTESLLNASKIDTIIEMERGFDHGVFIPLMMMYPNDRIPTIQVSLIRGLNPQRHVEMGKALKALKRENLLILGSGFSFHNMNEFSSSEENARDPKNDLFQDYLIKACTEAGTSSEHADGLLAWEKYPNARYCHPREEHLLPLHVCAGISDGAGQLVFDDYILGKRSIAVLWK